MILFNVIFRDKNGICSSYIIGWKCEIVLDNNDDDHSSTSIFSDELLRTLWTNI